MTITKKSLVCANIFTVLLFFLYFFKVPQHILHSYNRLKKNQHEVSYLENPHYGEVTDFYSAYTGQKNIVMLGNSLTYRITWQELLGRDDVANRGIGSDITDGFVHRLDYVLKLEPKICFIEGGVNDLVKNIPNYKTINNLSLIVDRLLKKKIIPVITTLTLVTKEYKDDVDFNDKIKLLNTQLYLLASDKKVKIIDLNPKLTDGNFLFAENAIDDGIHYSAKSYKVWKSEVLRILKEENI